MKRKLKRKGGSVCIGEARMFQEEEEEQIKAKMKGKGTEVSGR
jgi:hypothetical protein